MDRSAHELTWNDVPALMGDLRAMAQRLLSREQLAGGVQATALVLTALRRQKTKNETWDQVTWKTGRPHQNLATRYEFQLTSDKARAVSMSVAAGAALIWSRT
jgi:hypothetical protein